MGDKTNTSARQSQHSKSVLMEWTLSKNKHLSCSRSLLCVIGTCSPVCNNTSWGLRSRQVSSLSFAIHSSSPCASWLWSNRLLSVMNPWGVQSESSLTSVLIGPRVLPNLHWQQHLGSNETKHVFQIRNSWDVSTLQTDPDIWIGYQGGDADSATFVLFVKG